jgi:hypothetical protein
MPRLPVVSYAKPRRETKTIDGVTYTQTHGGQKKAYGDSFYEYEVTSDLPADEVERICREKIDKAIPLQQYQDEYREKPTASNHFRSHYRFTKRPDGTYFYSVCFPFTD